MLPPGGFCAGQAESAKLWQTLAAKVAVSNALRVDLPCSLADSTVVQTHQPMQSPSQERCVSPVGPVLMLQVDFAQGPEWEWVAGKLQQLSRALGNTRVAAMSGQHAVSMM